MIEKTCFTAEWLDQRRKELHTDAYHLERALHAFALLGHLAESGLDFVFKEQGYKQCFSGDHAMVQKTTKRYHKLR